MAATQWSKDGAMAWHPYSGGNYKLNAFRHALGLQPKGRWVHNPLHVAYRATKGAGLASAIGLGNFLTRDYRQKPIAGLQTATHTNLNKYKQKIVAKISDRKGAVNIPTVSSRRTKSYSTKNKILSINRAMPYRRYKRKSNTRAKKFKRSYRKKARIPLGIPTSKVVRFRLVQNNTFSGVGGAIFTNMIKANSLNDPTQALGANLPATLDQWASMYTKYIVLGSKLTIRFNNTTNTGAGVVGVHLHDNDTALTSTAHYRELPLTKQKVLTTQKDLTGITMKYSAKRFWKLKNIKDDSEQEASFSASPGDPSDIAYYHIYGADMVGAHNFTVDTQLELEFIVLLTNPINVDRSSL